MKKNINKEIFLFIIILVFFSILFNCQKYKDIEKENKNFIIQNDKKVNLSPDKNDKVFKGNIVLNSQMEIDTFGKNKYTFIDGSLTVNSPNNEYSKAIQNLDNLESIKVINGEVLITKIKSLTSISGLKNLEKVNGDFVISGCGLSQIKDINNMEIVNGDIIFNYNVGEYGKNGLKEIIGFDKLITVNNIFISSNSSLKKLDAFNKIENTNTIQIMSTELDSITNFKNLKNVHKNFSVEYSNLLTKICLQNLEKVNGFFGLNNNDKINGNIYLPKIKKINHLYLVDNKNFENYCGFSKDIKNKNIDTLTAYNNKVNPNKANILKMCK